MTTDLETRLRELTDLAPPSRRPLGTAELHDRATRLQRRAFATRAIPAAIVVLALLAGAVALRERSTSTDVVVGPPDAALTTEADGISERDQQVLAYLRTVIDLRHQLDREMVLTATYASTDAKRGRIELAEQRAATDVALASYTEQETAVAGLAASDPDLAPLIESMKQADNRIERLPTVRVAVDAIQNDATGLIESYANTTAALQDVQLKFIMGVDDPDVFRGVYTATNLGTFARQTALTSAYLTVAVEIGSYAEALPKGTNPAVVRGACDPDPADAGDQCKLFDIALGSSMDADMQEQLFQGFATGRQKQAFRAAHANSAFDEMRAAVFENGIGRNDQRGTEPGSYAIDPAEWQVAVLTRLDRLAEVERQFYEEIGTDAADDPPASIPSGDTGAVGTAPQPTTTVPASVTSTTVAATTGTREVILEPEVPGQEP